MEEKLIDFVRLNPFLYKKQHKDYRNLQLRKDKFQELARKTNIPAQKLRQKWKNMRDKFFRDAKRLAAPESGVNVPRIKWKWWNKMKFLLDVDDATRKTIEKYQRASWSPESVSYALSREPSIEDNPMASNSDAGTPSPTFITVHVSPPSSSTLALSPAPQTFAPPMQSSMEETLAKIRESWDTFLEKATSVMLTKPVNQPAKSHVQLFFESVANEVDDANINPQRLIEFKIEILKKVHELLYN